QTEQSQTEQSQTEQSQTEQSQTEQSQTEQSPKAKTREAGGYAGFVLLFVVGAKGFEPSTL
ncbi:hypothetical protein, partial [Paraburkholderia dipogonis]|uniref:hypothetical protein n=1 Tax=Paraburkholderia dipogonis TaxID=1211383 RepID=UPI003611A5C4